MVKIDASGLVRSLEEFQKEAKRKLEVMTREFCLSVVQKAAYNTPLGDATLYPDMYQMRHAATGLQAQEGLARYGWDAAVDSPVTIKEGYGRNTAEEAIAEARANLQAFKIGDTVLIGNKRDYVVGPLNQGYGSKQAPNGIMKPTVNEIQNAYKADLQRMYSNASVNK